MSAELIVLGAGGTFPNPGGACSGYLLRSEGYTVWVDAGNGTLGRLQEHAALEDVDAIYLSHAHPDHCVDLLPFFYALAYGLPQRAPIPVVAPAETQERLAGMIGDASRDRFGAVLAWRTFAPGDETELGPFRVRGFDSQHSAPNVTARFEAAGRVVCYSGDTGWTEHLPRAAEGADLLLCEASWQDADEAHAPIHLRAREAGRAAREAGCGRLALTHIWPRHDHEVSRGEAAEEFDGPVDLALQAERWTI